MPAQFVWFFLSFKGRISRQEFWLGYFFALAILFLLIPVLQDISLAVRRPASGAWYRNELVVALWLPKLVAAAIVTWPLTTLYVKRLHDLDFSGWWLLAFVAVLLVTTATGMDPKNYAGVAMFAVVGFVRGKRGDNRFGADPIV